MTLGNGREVMTIMTDSRNPKALTVSKKTLYVVDEAIVLSKTDRELDVFKNDCINIGEFYIPVNVLKHIDKHFLDLDNRDKVDLLHKLLHYKENKLSYAEFSLIDDRYKFEKRPCRIYRKIYNIVLDGKVYEVATIYKSTLKKRNGEDEVEQVCTMYEIDMSEQGRIKTVEASSYISSFINEDNVDDCSLLYKTTRHEEFHIPSITVSGDNIPSLLGEKLLVTVGGQDVRVMLENNVDNPVAVHKTENTNSTNENKKLNFSVLRAYLEERKDSLSVDDIMTIYTHDRLPKVDAKFALSLAINEKVIKPTDTLSVVVNLMLNVIKTNELYIHKMFLGKTNDNDISTLAYELDSELKKVSDLTGYSIGVIENKCLKLNK